MIVTPNLAGHQPSPRTTRDGLVQDDEVNLEIASKTPKLDVLKSALQESQSYSSDYLRRLQNSSDWLNSRWEGQTVDGRKWHTVGPQDSIWPWSGASDTRTHIVSKIVGQHETVGSFALRNMKIQAKSSRPFNSMQESQQATTLLNWMIGTHMQMEAYRESRLALNWRNAFGSAVMAVDWEQERRIDYIKVSLMTLSALTEAQGMAGQASLLQDLQGTDLMQWQSIIADETNEEALIPFIQRFSPIVTKAQARKIIKDLRELRFAEVPIPYIYLSKPRWRAMRPMIDIFFPVDADELNIRPRWTAEPERLTQTQLVDRIETANYDPGFVNEAINHKGNTLDGPWTNRILTDWRGNQNLDYDDKIEIWHFKYRALDRGTPVLYDTIFHMDVETEALHGPCQYSHGEFGYHDLRFERRDKPILSSKGIAEYAYTWQNEIKAQRDGRTDRVALTLRPPMFTRYQDMLRMKASFTPGIMIPEAREGTARFMPPPPYDSGSIEIEKTIMAAINEHFGLFGAEVDPILKQQRSAQLADDLLMEFKPIINQTWKLLPDYLPDAEVAAVVGPLSRPFHISRDQIQGQYEITLTVDMRNIDVEFLKTKLDAAVQVTALDTTGSIDRNKLVRLIMESIDPDLAAETVQDQQPATEKEIADERMQISLIIGSGVDQPLPKGSNYQLRLQTDQTMLQELAQNPAAGKKLNDNPDVMKVIENRMQFFQRQQQQIQNAQIGKMQVTQTFSKNAPQAALPVPEAVALINRGGQGQGQ
jgi:hypothetical protein